MYGQQYPGGPPQAFAWSLSFLNVTPLVWVCFFSRKRTGGRTCLFRRYRLVTFPPLATEISLFHSAVVGLFWRVVAFVIVVSSRTTRGRIGSVLGAWWKIEHHHAPGDRGIFFFPQTHNIYWYSYTRRFKQKQDMHKHFKISTKHFSISVGHS